MTDVDYAAAQRAVREQLRIELSASQLLDEWDALIVECEAGYRWDVSEFNNEMRSRDHLQLLLDSSELQRFVRHREFSREVARRDDRFRACLLSGATIPGARSWWRAGVLRSAGRGYATYFRTVHGFNVEEQ